VVHDGQDLSVGSAVADDEKVGDVAQLAEVQDDQVFGFLFEGCRDALNELTGQVFAQRFSS
jgi:hypothetical protein